MTPQGSRGARPRGFAPPAGDFRVETLSGGIRPAGAALARVALAATHPPARGQDAHARGGEFRDPGRRADPGDRRPGLSLGGVPTALAIMTADYASGPGLAYPLESAQPSRSASSRASWSATRALDRLAKVDVLLLDHHPRPRGPRAGSGLGARLPGHTEFQVLRFAASALKDLEDERTLALRAACRSRRIPLLDRIATEFGTDVTLHHRGQVIKVGNLGVQGPETSRGAPPATSRRSGRSIP